MRLAHFVKNNIAAMLRSDFQLTAYMLLYQFLEEAVVLVLKKVVKAYAASDKDALYFRKST